MSLRWISYTYTRSDWKGLDYVRAIPVTEGNIILVFDLLKDLGLKPAYTHKGRRLVWKNENSNYKNAAKIGMWIVREWDNHCFSLEKPEFKEQYIQQDDSEYPEYNERPEAN